MGFFAQKSNKFYKEPFKSEWFSTLLHVSWPKSLKLARDGIKKDIMVLCMFFMIGIYYTINYANVNKFFVQAFSSIGILSRKLKKKLIDIDRK